MVDIDFDMIADRSDDLINYDGFLPLLIRALIMDKWCNHLLNIGKYDDVMVECSENQPITFDDAIDELIVWIEDNKEYIDLIR